MTNPRIAVLGVGRWGINLVNGLVEAGAHVVAVDLHAGQRQHATAAGAVATAASLSDLRAHGARLDGVVLATPTLRHTQDGLEALDLAIPVYIEKPLTTDPAQARRLLAAGRGRLFALEKWRYHPAIEGLRVVARSGDLGRIEGIRTFRQYDVAPTHDVDPVWILAPHELSIVRHILGSVPSPTSATGEWRSQSGPVPVMAGMSARLDGTKRWAELVISGAAGRYERRVEVVCSSGIALFDQQRPTHLKIKPDDTDLERLVVVESALPTTRQMRAVVEHVRGGPPPLSSGIEGVESVEVIAALRQLAGHTHRGEAQPAARMSNGTSADSGGNR